MYNKRFRIAFIIMIIGLLGFATGMSPAVPEDWQGPVMFLSMTAAGISLIACLYYVMRKW